MIVEYIVSPTGIIQTQVVAQQSSSCTTVTQLTAQLGVQIGPVEQTGPDCPAVNTVVVDTNNYNG